jgi:hypothetical protein
VEQTLRSVERPKVGDGVLVQRGKATASSEVLRCRIWPGKGGDVGRGKVGEGDRDGVGQGNERWNRWMSRGERKRMSWMRPGWAGLSKLKIKRWVGKETKIVKSAETAKSAEGGRRATGYWMEKLRRNRKQDTRGELA